jgi:capsular exopolysaccharide synthesis family protein
MMQQQEPESQVIGLREFLQVIRRRKRSVAVVTVLAAVVGLGMVAFRAPVFTSRAQVEVRPVTVDAQLQPFATDSFVNMDTEAARVTLEPIGMLAASAMGLDPTSPADLADVAEDVSVTVQPNTTYLDISCTRESAEEARECAGSFAAAYVQDRVRGARRLFEERTSDEQDRIREATDRVEQLRSQLSEPGAPRASIRAQIETQNQLITAAQTNLLSLPTASPDAAVLSRSAELPAAPSNKDYLRATALAAVLGLALGIGLAFVRERLTEPIAGREALEQVLEAPVLAAVPKLPTPLYGRRPILVTLSASESPASQAYRGAGAALLHLAGEGSLNVIALTGPSQGEGKTPATGNLAVALAQSGRQVVAVSCDLRNPTLHAYLNRDNEVGLTDLLMGGASVGEASQETEVSGLFFIASGPMPDNPTDLLGSEDMGRLLTALRTRFDFVLLDAGPSLVADVLFVAPHADGVIVVADAAKTSRGGVAQLRHQLESVGSLIIGGILNNVAAKFTGHPYPYYLQPDPGTRRLAESAEDRPTAEWSGPRTRRDGNRSALSLRVETSDDADVSRAGLGVPAVEDNQ